MHMYTRGLSTRDIEEAFRDLLTRQMLLGRTAASELTDSLWRVPSSKNVAAPKPSLASSTNAAVSSWCLPLSGRPASGSTASVCPISNVNNSTTCDTDLA